MGIKNAIEIKDLRKSYKDFSLNKISFCLPAGCMMGLVGLNGRQNHDDPVNVEYDRANRG